MPPLPGRILLVALAAAVATPVVAPAQAAVPGAGRQRLARVVKNARSEKVQIYWAEPMGGTEVRVMPYLDAILAGAEYDVIDQRGYVGRVRVARVEIVDIGCAGVKYHHGVGNVELVRRDWNERSATIAVTATRADLRRARVVMPDQMAAGDLPKLTGQNYPDIGLDTDGDGRLEFARFYRDCLTPAAPGGGGTGQAYCVDLYRRDRSQKWALHSTVAIPECY